jgi:competence protein ComEA
MRPVAYVLIGLLAGFVLSGALLLTTRPPQGEAVVLQPAPTRPPIVVHVVGAVPKPGVYEFPQGSRVRDAVAAAGGLLAEADPAALNLAAMLEDGQRLEIPYQAGAEPASASAQGINSESTPSADLININTATLEELDSLPGIGPTTAQKIIEYRQQHGPFQTIEDIMNVSGIGPATFDKIKDLITV